MKLTPLQKLGISHLLVNFRYHGNSWFKSGKIIFKHNSISKDYQMWVISYERDITLMFELKECENIDYTEEYECRYDETDLMFIIENMKEKPVLC